MFWYLFNGYATHELSFTWCWQNEPGVTSQVVVRLQQNGTNTLMHFEHNGVGTASAHNYLAGWLEENF